jgi:hypothetical protein
MNRAHRGQDLFLDNADRDIFLSLLKETATMFNLSGMSQYSSVSSEVMRVTEQGQMTACFRKD